jgi:hypothetical protein
MNKILDTIQRKKEGGSPGGRVKNLARNKQTRSVTSYLARIYDNESFSHIPISHINKKEEEEEEERPHF